MEKHLPRLDGFRALAALIVLADHLWRHPTGNDAINNVMGAGWLGVDLFFVLSGFLITSILVKSRDNSHYFRNFYIRRALRIFPAYYLMLFLLFVCLPLFSHTPELIAERGKALWHLAYLSNVIIGLDGWTLGLVAICWSLSIEEQFYLIWPLLIRYCTRQRLIAVCWALVIAAPIARWALFGRVGWTWDFVATPLRADAFAWGALIAIGQLDRWKRHARAVTLTLVPFILIMAASGHLKRDTPWVSSIGYSLGEMTAAAALLWTLCTDSTVLASRPLREVGKISYGLYLLHPMTALLLNHFWEPKTLLTSVAFVLVGSGACIAVAMASFRMIESPFLRLKDRLSPPKTALALAPT